MHKHWFVATCSLANPYAGQRDRSGFTLAMKAFSKVYGRGDTPEAAEADCRKWLERRIKQYEKQPESKYTPLSIGTADDWKVEPFTMPTPKFKIGQRVWKVRDHAGKTIPVAKRKIERVRFNADHPNSIGTFCSHVDSVGGLGLAFMESEKDFEVVTTKATARKRAA